jgi:hypothetical protein
MEFTQLMDSKLNFPLFTFRGEQRDIGQIRRHAGAVIISYKSTSGNCAAKASAASFSIAHRSATRLK